MSGERPSHAQLPLSAYPHVLPHRLRYGDTDRQGHINNAVYATLLEFGRTELFYGLQPPLIGKGMEPVLARIAIDYHREMHWPGDITVATALLKMGRSSLTMVQGVFGPQGCAASGEAVIVQLDSASRRPHPWDDRQREAMQAFALHGQA